MNVKLYQLFYMKKAIISILICVLFVFSVNAQTGKKALLIIDIQDFYFPGGSSALVDPEKAAVNAALILDMFRKENLPVIHIRHNSGTGGNINKLVSPLPEEKVFSKDEINCFIGTGLNDFLKSANIDSLVICGMQTHLCVEAATRAASDLGYKCILIHDACATKDLKFGEKIIKAEDVHLSTLNTLKNYSLVLSTSEYLKKK
jgi:nicotinamidase-related amidase